MNKIKVSKEVAIALDTALRVMDKEKIFEEHSNKLAWNLSVYQSLNQFSNTEMAKILINGYEVEETPEEILLKNYEIPPLNEFERGLDEGIKFTLNTLNIKIKGIND